MSKLQRKILLKFKAGESLTKAEIKAMGKFFNELNTKRKHTRECEKKLEFKLSKANRLLYERFISGEDFDDDELRKMVIIFKKI